MTIFRIVELDERSHDGAVLNALYVDGLVAQEGLAYLKAEAIVEAAIAPGDTFEEGQHRATYEQFLARKAHERWFDSQKYPTKGGEMNEVQD